MGMGIKEVKIENILDIWRSNAKYLEKFEFLKDYNFCDGKS